MLFLIMGFYVIVVASDRFTAPGLHNNLANRNNGKAFLWYSNESSLRGKRIGTFRADSTLVVYRGFTNCTAVVDAGKSQSICTSKEQAIHLKAA
jgi:hypothetical protein